MKPTTECLTRVMSAVVLAMIFVGIFIVKTRNSQFVLAQSQKALKLDENPKPKPENNYLFSEGTPRGSWLLQGADFDLQQIDNPNIPVVIAGIRSYVGKGNWRKHLMIESIVLKNRSAKAVKAFRLGWFIMTGEDRQTGKNREAALLQGYSALIEADSAEQLTTEYRGPLQPQTMAGWFLTAR